LICRVRFVLPLSRSRIAAGVTILLNSFFLRPIVLHAEQRWMAIAERPIVRCSRRSNRTSPWTCRRPIIPGTLRRRSPRHPEGSEANGSNGSLHSFKSGATRSSDLLRRHRGRAKLALRVLSPRAGTCFTAWHVGDLQLERGMLDLESDRYGVMGLAKDVFGISVLLDLEMGTQ